MRDIGWNTQTTTNTHAKGIHHTITEECPLLSHCLTNRTCSLSLFGIAVDDFATRGVSVAKARAIVGGTLDPISCTAVITPASVDCEANVCEEQSYRVSTQSGGSDAVETLQLCEGCNFRYSRKSCLGATD